MHVYGRAGEPYHVLYHNRSRPRYNPYSRRRRCTALSPSLSLSLRLALTFMLRAPTNFGSPTKDISSEERGRGQMDDGFIMERARRGGVAVSPHLSDRDIYPMRHSTGSLCISIRGLPNMTSAKNRVRERSKTPQICRQTVHTYDDRKGPRGSIKMDVIYMFTLHELCG